MRTIELTWCTNFNGINYHIPDSTSVDDTLTDKLNDVTDLPSVTWNIVGEDKMEAVNEGDIDGEDIADCVGDADIKNLIEAARKEIVLQTDEKFNIKFSFNLTDT